MARVIDLIEHPAYMAVVVPYRDRLNHLQQFVPYMKDVLRNVDFRFVVIEQMDDRPFNAGLLKNVGFTLVAPSSQCVCFHDVDMLPLDGCHGYLGVTNTTHLAGCAEQYGFALPYPEYCGGVLCVHKTEFALANGYSNEYWGWGEEDDDLWLRYQMASLSMLRRSGRYTSLPHARAEHPRSNVGRIARTMVEAAKRCSSLDMLTRIAQVSTEHGINLNVEPADSSRDGLCSLSYSIVRVQGLVDILPDAQGLRAVDQVVSVTT